MLESYLRPAYQFCIADLAAKGIAHIPPVYITGAACASGILVVPTLLLGFTKLAILLLVISGFLDTLDGTVARLTGNTSATGSILDIVSDRIVESAVIFALFAVDPSHRSWLAFFMLMSCYICITSFLVVGIFTQNQSAKEFHYNPGLIERTEAFLFFIAMMWWPDYFGLLSSLFICLVCLTSYLHIKTFIVKPQRVIKFK